MEGAWVGHDINQINLEQHDPNAGDTPGPFEHLAVVVPDVPLGNDVPADQYLSEEEFTPTFGALEGFMEVSELNLFEAIWCLRSRQSVRKTT